MRIHSWHNSTFLLHLMARVHAIELVEPSSTLLHMPVCRGHMTTKWWHHISCSCLQRQTFHQSILFCYHRGIQARSSFVEQQTWVSTYSCWNSQTPLHLFYINRASGSTWRNSQIVTNPKLNVFINQSLLMFYSLSILTIKMWNLQTWRVTKYDGYWWLGCVMLTFPGQNEVEINFLQSNGATRSFHYLRSSDLLRIPCVEVDSRTSTTSTRAYALNAHEMQAATIALERQNI